ncbi:MAG: hypothetical protein JWN04_575, partial [Myxococcaceae bacterium]|nr:hypothetical protein [Myxococcaceae bacterium]
MAKRHGLRSWKTIWEAPENEALRQLRRNPNVVWAGDSVFVPGAELGELERATDQT